jgi:hypothetical protein
LEQITGKKVGGIIANECCALATVNDGAVAAYRIAGGGCTGNGPRAPDRRHGSMGLNSMRHKSQQ